MASDLAAAGHGLDKLASLDQPMGAGPATRSTRGDDDDQEEEDQAGPNSDQTVSSRLVQGQEARNSLRRNVR